MVEKKAHWNTGRKRPDISRALKGNRFGMKGDEALNEKIFIRVSKREKEAIRRHALEKNMSVSEVVRLLIHKECIDKKESDA